MIDLAKDLLCNYAGPSWIMALTMRSRDEWRHEHLQGEKLRKQGVSARQNAAFYQGTFIKSPISCSLVGQILQIWRPTWLWSCKCQRLINCETLMALSPGDAGLLSSYWTIYGWKYKKRTWRWWEVRCFSSRFEKMLHSFVVMESLFVINLQGLNHKLHQILHKQPNWFLK